MLSGPRMVKFGTGSPSKIGYKLEAKGRLPETFEDDIADMFGTAYVLYHNELEPHLQALALESARGRSYVEVVIRPIDELPYARCKLSVRLRFRRKVDHEQLKQILDDHLCQVRSKFQRAIMSEKLDSRAAETFAAVHAGEEPLEALRGENDWFVGDPSTAFAEFDGATSEEVDETTHEHAVPDDDNVVLIHLHAAA